MRSNVTYAAVALMSATAMAFALPAHAACKRFGFTVNDYGKEGPTNDAKELLDKHVAEWATQNGITDFKVGKKSVTCELFLDFVVFDEYTCTAKADVCWGGASGESSDLIEEADVETPPAPIRKLAGGAAASGESVEAVVATTQEKAVTLSTGAGSQAVTETTTASSEVVDSAVLTFREAAAGSGPPPAKVALEAMTMAKRAETSPAEQKSPERVPSSATVETGALAGDKAKVPNPPKAAPAGEAVEVETETVTITTAPADDAASKAATAAAAAAERAAMAAERAAAAAKEAAAAALAAREATQKPVMVPALTPPPTGGTGLTP